VRNPILLRQSARINDSLRQFAFVMPQRKTQINPRIRSRLDLRKHMFTVQRHDRLARTRLHIRAHRLPQLQ